MRSGDPCATCPECPGTMNVYRSRRRGASVVRYLRCSQCGLTGKQVLASEDVRRRQRVVTLLSKPMAQHEAA